MTEPISSETNTWTTRQVIGAILTALTIALGFWLLFQIRLTVLALFVAIVIATALKPLVAWLNGRNVSFLPASILVYGVLLAIISGFVLLIVPLLLEQIVTIAADIPNYYEILRADLSSSSNRIIRRFGWELPPRLTASVVQSGSEDVAVDTMAQLLGYVNLTMKTFVSLIGTLLLSFYWLRGWLAYYTFIALVCACSSSLWNTISTGYNNLQSGGLCTWAGHFVRNYR